MPLARKVYPVNASFNPPFSFRKNDSLLTHPQQPGGVLSRDGSQPDPAVHSSTSFKLPVYHFPANDMLEQQVCRKERRKQIKLPYCPYPEQTPQDKPRFRYNRTPPSWENCRHSAKTPPHIPPVRCIPCTRMGSRHKQAPERCRLPFSFRILRIQRFSDYLLTGSADSDRKSVV